MPTGYKITQKEAEERAKEKGFELIEQYVDSKTKVKFRCFCGKEIECNPEKIFSGRKKSCGCLNNYTGKSISEEEAKSRFLNVGIYMVGTYINSHTKTEFKCPLCGKIFIAKPSSVRNQKSCGCLKGRLQSLTKLEVEERLKPTGISLIGEYISSSVKTKFRCFCGKEFEATPNAIFQKKTKSCGCFKRELISKIMKKSLIGKKFGKLLVLEEIKKRQNKQILYKCQCDCGKIIIILGQTLSSGKTISCRRCSKFIPSRGERKIIEVLSLYNIPFIEEKTYENLRNPHTNRKLFFDIYIEKYNLLIEYNGKQHYLNLDKERLIKQQYRDQLKRDFCKNEGIELLEIPYWDFNKIEEILVRKLGLTHVSL